MEIKCTKEERDQLLGIFCDNCPFMETVSDKRCEAYDECAECVEDNIKFEIVSEGRML